MGEITRRIYGQVSPFEDVHLLQERVGDAQRKQTVRHIEDMHKAGYISADEAAIRQDHAAEAETQSELHNLTSDLPALIDNRNFIQKWNWDDSKYHLPVLIGGMAFSILLPLITGLLLNLSQMLDTRTGDAVFYPILAIGIMGFFLNLVFLVIKSS